MSETIAAAGKFYLVDIEKLRNCYKLCTDKGSDHVVCGVVALDQ